MLRLLFEKKGKAIWISHLDLMRLFQRAFKRAELPLTHTHGFNPRPSVSIALPLSVGMQSSCELLDFELDGIEIDCDEICERLNQCLVEGIRVLCVYPDGQKLKYLSYLKCSVTLHYDTQVPECATEIICQFFTQQEIFVEKKNKNGVQEQNISPMIREMTVEQHGDHTVVLNAVICCQNPSLNPMQLYAAICKHLPELKPDHVSYSRHEIFDTNHCIFR